MPDAAVLLVDDLRNFRDPVEAVIARTSQAGVDALRERHANGGHWLQVWLDHDLGDATGSNDHIGPVVDWLCTQSAAGHRVRIGGVVVHTSNVVGGDWMVLALRRAGYAVARVSASDYFTGVTDA